VSGKRYAIVGASNRAFCMFYKPILETFRHRTEMVALLDKDRSRMSRFNRETGTNFPVFLPDWSGEMAKTICSDVVMEYDGGAFFNGIFAH
jgi:predicted dehydrogenase